MDALHTDFFTTFDVFVEVVHEDGFVWTHPELLQGNLEDPRFGLHRAHFRRDDHLVEGIVEFFPDDISAQVAPGVRDESRFVFAAQGPDVLEQRTVNDVSGEEFIAYGCQFGGWTFQPLDDERPMFLRTDLANGCPVACITFEDDPVQVVVVHTEPVSELLARRLKLRADNDSAEVEEDSFDGHLLFLVVFFPFDVVAALAFFASTFLGAGFADVDFAVGFSAFGSGLGAASAAGAGSCVGKGASC